MSPASPPRLRILSVGGNAVSAFLSWRLQATNACDVTLVWKSGFEQVSQYGISFRSNQFGNERFKPRHGKNFIISSRIPKLRGFRSPLLLLQPQSFNLAQGCATADPDATVVSSPDEAAGRKGAFDYVLLCVKALPDVYDLAAVVEPVVTPQHTCILVNTTHSLGIESHLEQRFPTNVVLSLVSGAEIVQLGASEFEHVGSTDVWVGTANKNAAIPAAIQNDMAEALAMTLTTGQVDCQVSQNIRQQQYERMIGPIAFHPLSVLFETPDHAELLEKVGVRQLLLAVVDELLQIASAHHCVFDSNFKERTIETLGRSGSTQSIMYQDYVARRPMEVETYLGSPLNLAQEKNISVPRLATVYALLHHCNIVNQQKPASNRSPSNQPTQTPPPPRISSNNPGPPSRHGMNGGMNGSMRGGRMGGPPMRRGGGPFPGPHPSNRPINGYPPRQQSNGYSGSGRPPIASNQVSRRPSPEGDDLNEFSHLVLYDENIEPDATGYTDGPAGAAGQGTGNDYNPHDMALRERELALRQRELQLREQEFRIRRGSRKPPPSRGGYDDEDEDEDDFFDPMAGGSGMPNIDPDNVDMMSVTSRRTRRMPSHSQIRANPEIGAMGRAGMRSSQNFGGRPALNRNRISAQVLDASMPCLHEDLLSNPMTAYASNRYGTVDRKEIASESRSNSLTATRLSQLQGAGNNAGMNGAYPSPTPFRRGSQAAGGNPYGPRKMSHGIPGPDDGYASSRPSTAVPPLPPGPPGMGMHVGPQGLMRPGPGGSQRGSRYPSVSGPADAAYPGMPASSMNGERGTPLPLAHPGQPGRSGQPDQSQTYQYNNPNPNVPVGPGHSNYPHVNPSTNIGMNGSSPLPNGTNTNDMHGAQPTSTKTVRSLTGSASASASGGSGDSAPADSDPSAHSSQSSLAARQYHARYPAGQAIGMMS